MAQSITPRYMADTVVCQRVSLDYNQTWDGANWVIDPTTIQVLGLGIMASNGAETTRADILLTADQLPPAGQAALQDLLQYLEGEMVTKYG